MNLTHILQDLDIVANLKSNVQGGESKGFDLLDKAFLGISSDGSSPYFLKLTAGVVTMLAGFVGLATIVWAGIIFFGTSGFWNVLRHEVVDPKCKVKTWKEVEVSDKRKNSDYNGPRLETPVKLPFTEPLFSSLLKDERDLPLLHVLVSSTCILIPMAVTVYSLFIYANFYVACFFGLIVYQFVRVYFFMHSMLHYRHFSSHRPLFKIKALNYLSNIYLDPMMGIPPVVFLLHHTVMHHVGNNGFYDISTTEPYQRDSWTAFANYWFRFQVMAYLELPLFAWKTGRKEWFFTAVLVIGSFFFWIVYMSDVYSGWATFCVFGAPWLLDHADDGKRNWCQHLFAVQYDSKAPADTFWDVNCGLAYNLVDSLENRQQFNEGYHVVHHAYGGNHWTTIPDTFYEHVEKMATYKKDLLCITFIDSSIWEVWSHVASNKLPQLVKNKFVHIPTASRPNPPSVEEVVIELKARLQPLDFSMRKAPEKQTQKRKAWQRQASLSKAVVLSDSFRQTIPIDDEE